MPSKDEKKIRVPRMEHCNTCNGSGAAAGTSPKTCDTCGGQGVVIQRQGFYRSKQPVSL